jgi:MoxR-like ATPase
VESVLSEREALLIEKLEQEVLTPLRQKFVGKDEVIELIAVTVLAQENLLVLGPPGTAKSDLVASFAAAISGRYFQYLLTKFTEPNEVFGPVDIAKLREGTVVTNTEGMLPEAEIAFLDEVFNANSAILNSLLTILNERTFRRGRQATRLPLLAVFGASNLLPEDDSLRALFDRFLLRVMSENVDDTVLPQLFVKGWQVEKSRLAQMTITENRTIAENLTVTENLDSLPLSTAELRELAVAVATVALEAIREPYLKLVKQIRTAGIEITDRRLIKLLRAIAAAALLRKRKVATPADLWVLRYIWDNQDQARVLKEIVQTALNGYLAENPTETYHRLVVPPLPFTLAGLINETKDLVAEIDRQPPENFLQADLWLARIDDLVRKLEWAKPANVTESGHQQEALTQLRARALSLELPEQTAKS